MKRSLTLLVFGALMLALTASVVGATENVLPITPVSVMSSGLECEGDACAQVTLTFDEAQQQYKVHNHSDRTVRVEASNLAGGNRVLVAAGKEAYLAMKSIVGPYRANYE